MTAAPFIAFACASPADADDLSSSTEPFSVHGAFLQAPGQGMLRAELGMAGALPTALLGATAGLSPKMDFGAHAVTHAGLAHALGLTGRYRVAPRQAVGLTVDESIYTVESLAGIESLRSPFGNRVAVVPQWLLASRTASGAALGWTVGAEVGLLRLQRVPDSSPPSPAQRALRPALDHVWGEVAASWPRRNGALFVRLRAIVPVAAEFHVLGYLPWLAVGRSWSPR